MKWRSGILLLLLSVSAGQFLNGQRAATFSLKASPLSLFIHSPRFGAEYRWSEDEAVDVEAGWFFPSNDLYNDHNKGVVARVEYRFDYSENETHFFKQEHYLGFELFYKHQSYEISDSSVAVVFRPFEVSKDVECATFRFGVTNTFKCGIFYDFSGGIGIRIKEAKNSLPAYENAQMEPTTDYGPNIFFNKAGFSVWPNLDFGLKVGYVFGRR